MISAGVYAFPRSILSPYIGAGYGFRTYSLSDTDGHWAQVKDLSTKGMNLDAGLLLRLGHFIAGAGANLTFPFAQQSPKYLELTVSLGVSF